MSSDAVFKLLTINIYLLAMLLSLYSCVQDNRQVPKDTAHVNDTTQLNINTFLDSIQKEKTKNTGSYFALFKSISMHGKSYSNINLKKKVTLINFWFENCPPCIAEFSSLNNLVEKFKTTNEFQLITFTFESPDEIKKLVKKNNLKFEIISISQDQCYSLNFNSGFPTTIITDQNAKVTFIDIGAPTDILVIKKNFENVIIPKIISLLSN